MRQNRLDEAVIMSTNNLCFGEKIRKNEYPCKSQFYYIKVGCKGVFITRSCVRDGLVLPSCTRTFSFHDSIRANKIIYYKRLNKLEHKRKTNYIISR